MIENTRYRFLSLNSSLLVSLVRKYWSPIEQQSSAQRTSKPPVVSATPTLRSESLRSFPEFYFIARIDPFGIVASYRVLKGFRGLIPHSSNQQPPPNYAPYQSAQKPILCAANKIWFSLAIQHSKQLPQPLLRHLPLCSLDISICILPRPLCAQRTYELWKLCIVSHHLGSSPY